jgi:hypothetical protein
VCVCAWLELFVHVRFVGDKRLGVLEAVPVLASEGLTSHELLVATHLELLRVWLGVRVVTGVPAPRNKHVTNESKFRGKLKDSDDK